MFGMAGVQGWAARDGTRVQDLGRPCRVLISQGGGGWEGECVARTRLPACLLGYVPLACAYEYNKHSSSLDFTPISPNTTHQSAKHLHSPKLNFFQNLTFNLGVNILKSIIQIKIFPFIKLLKNVLILLPQNFSQKIHELHSVAYLK